MCYKYNLKVTLRHNVYKVSYLDILSVANQCSYQQSPTEAT
jgi:hypothetical protein